MPLRLWGSKEATSKPTESDTAPGSDGLSKVVTHRQFLKVLAGALGGAGLGWLAGGAPQARATYYNGPPDRIDANLNVQGDLTVTSEHGPGNVGIGTTSPQGKLDVAGEILVNGVVVVDSQGVVSSSYYAP